MARDGEFKHRLAQHEFVAGLQQLRLLGRQLRAVEKAPVGAAEILEIELLAYSLDLSMSARDFTRRVERNKVDIRIDAAIRIHAADRNQIFVQRETAQL